MKNKGLLVTTMLVSLLASAAASADTGQSMEADIDLRYRFEHVDDGNLERDAQASTLRTRVGVTVHPQTTISARVELTDVSILGVGDFQSGAPRPDGNEDRPTIIDPPATQLHQAWLRWQTEQVTATLGRQRVLLGNQRFVGNVGWRQNEQTFVGARLDYQPDENWQLSYMALDRVYRIFGPDNPTGRHDLTGSHLLHIEFSAGDFGQLQGFHYRVHNRDLAAFSIATTGLRWFGKRYTVFLPLYWDTSVAHQSDTANAPLSFSARYWQLKLGSEVAGIRFDAAIEELSGSDDPGEAFRTPLATLHAFNGWADRFLATPDAGLRDQSLGLAGQHFGLNWSARWHHFETEQDSTGLGNEVNLAVGRKLVKNLNIQLKLADFRSTDNGPGDSRKYWLTMATQF